MITDKDWRRKPALYWVVASLLAANILCSWAIANFRASFALTRPDRAHTYGIQFRGDSMYYFPRLLGEYLDMSLIVNLSLFLALIAIVLITRRRRRQKVRSVNM